MTDEPKDYCAIVREHLTSAVAMVDGAIAALDRADYEASNAGSLSIDDITDQLEEVKGMIAVEYEFAASLEQ
jgi:hypothetical protein